MPITINGTGSITGISAGGLNDGIITQPELATGVAGTGPAFSAYMGSTQALTAATITKLAFNTETFDTNLNFDTSTYRFTPTVSGYYQISAAFYGAQPQSGDYSVNIYKNGASYAGSGFNAGTAFSGGYVQRPSISVLVYLNGTTDYIEIYGYVGVTQTILSGVANTFFTGAMVRAA